MEGLRKLEENRKRKIQVKFRVDEQEYLYIKRKVELSGKGTLTRYLRYMSILGKIVNIQLEDIKITTVNIGKISENINQIFKCVSSTTNKYDNDINEIKNKMNDIWQEIKLSRLQLRSLSHTELL